MKQENKTFSEIVTILKRHLSPKPLLIAERFRFHKRDQREDESINTYVAEIKKLPKHCEFGTVLNDSLRDRFVCGLHNEIIQKRLLVETSLTFEKALKIAIAMETATKDAVELTGKTKAESSVNSIHEAHGYNIDVTDVGKRDMTHNNAILRINIVETVEKMDI